MSAWICRSLTARPRYRLFHLVLESHDGRAQVPIPKRSTSPRVTSTAAEGDSLKVLDPEWPIREADMVALGCWLDPVATDPQRKWVVTQYDWPKRSRRRNSAIIAPRL
jgi:hypothetical protein